jgi:hypothetical protein
VEISQYRGHSLRDKLLRFHRYSKQEQFGNDRKQVDEFM